MLQSLRDLQASQGATFAEHQVPESFGNDAAAINAIENGVTLVDRTHWGRVEVAGADRLRFLHNQSTNAFQTLQPGQGCDTVFVNSTARTIDLVSAYVLDESVLLLTSPGYNQTLIQWMDRFIFFADKVELHDRTDSTITFSLVGAGAATFLAQLGGAIEPTVGNHQLLEIQGIPVRVAVGSGLATPGYTLIADIEQAVPLWQCLSDAGAIPCGNQVWEQLRIQQGRPMPGHELTEEINPLEAGLWYTISLDKGCYIGQETIARLHTYRGVKQQLWGVRLEQAVPPESVISVETEKAETEKIGKLTSCIATPDGYRGLAYIRTKASRPGLNVRVGESLGELVTVPFLQYDYP